MPKDKDGTPKSFGFVEYKHQKSVPYALSVFAGTKLFNRELRLNPRDGNTGSNKPQMALEPQPMMANNLPTHQFQMHNPSLEALRYGMSANAGIFSDMMPRMPNFPQINANAQIDMEALLGLSAQMLHNGMVGNDLADDTHSHQTKMLHRHENRSHHQNSNYGRRNEREYDRDYDRRGGNDRRDRDRRNRSRERDRSRERGDHNSNKRRHDRGRH